MDAELINADRELIARLTNDAPEPIVPPDADLRGLQYMPLEVARLRDSDLATKATGDEFRAAVLLWCAAWTQLPAGSLPTDDESLAYLAGFGRGKFSLREWKRVRTGALRGWKVHTDGRLHHHVLSEKVVEAWVERTEYRSRKAADEVRLEENRKERKRLRKELKDKGISTRWDMPMQELRGLHESTFDGDNPQRGGGVAGGVAGDPPATDKKGREGKGREGKGRESVSGARPDAGAGTQAGTGAPARTREAADICKGLLSVGVIGCNAQHPDLLAVLEAGATAAHIVETAKEITDRKGKAPNFGYVMATVRGRLEEGRPVTRLQPKQSVAKDYKSDVPDALAGDDDDEAAA